MAIRSTTSRNQPPPPFYALHRVGVHRNVHLGSEATRRGEPVTINVILGRQIDTAISITSTTPTLPGPFTQHVIGFQLRLRL